MISVSNTVNYIFESNKYSLDLVTEQKMDQIRKTYKQERIQMKNKKARHVHFVEDVNSKNSEESKEDESPVLFTELTDEDIERMWWSLDDMFEFKQSVHNIAMQSQENSSVRRCLRNAMKASLDSTDYSFWNEKYRLNAEGRVMQEELIRNKVVLNEETGSLAFQGLVNWCKHHGESRGLEKWSCPVHFNDRERLQTNIIADVLNEQMRQRLTNDNDQSAESREKKELALRTASLQTSW